MQNILTVYKFDLPFIDNNYGEAIYNTICTNLKEELLYLDIFLDLDLEKTNIYLKTSIKFQGGFINILFNKDLKTYFIPRFELNLYLDDSIYEKNINNIILKIFDSINGLGIDNYIFDIASEYIDKNISVLYLSYIEKVFKTNNKLDSLIKNINKKYIEFELENNIDLKYSLYYMIFLLYVFYKNYINGEKEIKELDKLINIENREEFKDNLLYSERKLVHILNLNLRTFKKYKLMLDNLFESFSK